MNSATRKPPVGKATVVKRPAGPEPGHRRRLPTTVSLLATCSRLRRPLVRHAQVTALVSSAMPELLQTSRSSIPAVGQERPAIGDRCRLIRFNVAPFSAEICRASQLLTPAALPAISIRSTCASSLHFEAGT